MKKRIFLLVLLSFILCGCTAEVNIDLDRISVTEESILRIDTTDPEVLEDYRIIFREHMPAFYDVAVTEDDPDVANRGITYYDYKKTEQNYGYDLTYKHKFSIEDYNSSRLLRNSFKSAYVVKDSLDDTIEFYTDSDGIILMRRYPQLSNVRVNIKTDLLVLETNADKVDGNVYTWNFDRSNYTRNIYIKTSRSKKSSSGKQDNPEKKEDEKPDEGEGKDSGEVKPKSNGNVGITKTTTVDPEREEKNKLAWMLIPLAILGLIVVVFVVNAASKLKNK